MTTSHDALDAVIAALTARAASRGMTIRPGHQEEAAVRSKGRIALPKASLSLLA
jgi:predicted nuclease with RNAse H fold